MTRSSLQSTVIQYTVIVTFNMILNHEIGRNAYDSVWEDPVLKNLTTTMKNITANGTALNNGTSNNSTLALGSAVPLSGDSEGFYFSYLPRNVLVHALLCPLVYYWHIYLERLFPVRPRGVKIAYAKKEKVEVDVNEGQEEEVVKRWIAQGKVRRSSVSWWNTFVKWVLHITIGKLLFLSLRHVLDGFLRWRSITTSLGTLKGFVIIGLFSQFLSTGPFASLIGFIIIPAVKRVVFEAGIDAVENVFVSSFARLAVPWLVRTAFIQALMSDATENILKSQDVFKSQDQGGVGGMNGRLIGEL